MCGGGGIALEVFPLVSVVIATWVFGTTLVSVLCLCFLMLLCLACLWCFCVFDSTAFGILVSFDATLDT